MNVHNFKPAFSVNLDLKDRRNSVSMQNFIDNGWEQLEAVPIDHPPQQAVIHFIN